MKIKSSGCGCCLAGPALAILVMVALTMFICNYIAPKVTDYYAKSYINSIGVSAAAEGTVYNKQYIAAHTDHYRTYFTTYSSFRPEEWIIDIKRYDSTLQKWETAHYDVNKETFDKIKIGDYYKDPLSRTAFFEYDRT